MFGDDARRGIRIALRLLDADQRERGGDIRVRLVGGHAPRAAPTFADQAARISVRQHVVATQPEIGHDMSAVRREIIRHVLHHV